MAASWNLDWLFDLFDLFDLSGILLSAQFRVLFQVLILGRSYYDYQKKPNWIDFNAGGVATGEENIETSGERLFEKVRECASGQKALNEINGYKEIAIFKDGVVL